MTNAAVSVSVVMTAFNREAFIAPAIESVLAQRFTDFELLIVDDRSTDATLAIAHDYARRDSRIRVIQNDRNLGDYPNRNHAAGFARGEYLKFHDSDDVMYPHCLEVMHGMLAAEPRAGIALSGSKAWPGGPCPMLLTPRESYQREYFGDGLFHLGPAAALFRTSVFRELGGFPTIGIASDFAFWIRACARTPVLLVPADLFYWRVHPAQESEKTIAAADNARASAEGWRILGDPACPLTPGELPHARQNFAWNVARGMFRRARTGRYDLAWTIWRTSGLTLADAIRYVRRPQRSLNAGSPARDV